ncbi:MAG: hypothetical protein OXK76_16210 [Gammaproteobacteria bacterium]|nr:hypothetical protein [Gammaproteobacteria bacterium]
MDLQTLIAQWSGKLPPGFVPQAVLRDEPEECSLCGATHKAHYVARVVMWSRGAKALNLIEFGCRNST